MMRLGLAMIAVAVTALLLCANSASADVDQPGAPKYANRVLSDFVTPVVMPGETVMFAFRVSNPYSGIDDSMMDISLLVGIYRYATQDSSKAVNATFPHPPRIWGNGTEHSLFLSSMRPGTNTSEFLPIETSRNTPHGSYFSQSTYFVRFQLTFNFKSNSTTVVLKSRGYFTDEQWNRMVSFSSGEPIVDAEYMKSLGVDGLLPDSSFGIKAPIPRWPLAAIVVGIGGLTVAAFFIYTLENPGKYPRLEQRLYNLRGKLRELRGKP